MRWRLVIVLLVLGLGLSACVSPILLQAPAISGTAEVGETLTVSPGQWLLSGVFSFQWQRCELDGSGCVDIGSATASTFVPTAAEVGKRLRVRVANTNQFGTATAFTALTGAVGAGGAPSTSRASVASDGSQADAVSMGEDISGDGRYVAFSSWASNLVPGDTNGTSDIFRRDVQTGVTIRASVASDGSQADGASSGWGMSDDGRYLVFGSGASNLVPGDTNGFGDVFVHDVQTGVTTRVSVASDGTQANSAWFGNSPDLSGDGRYVVFSSEASNLVPGDTNGLSDTFVHDMQTGATTRVSVASDGTQANDGSYFGADPRLSGDGRYVTFTSGASNLVAGDTNGAEDIFVHDRQTGVTSRVSVASDGTQADSESAIGALSGDGRYVVFYSAASNLVGGDTNLTWDVFVHDRQTGVTSRVSVASDGTQADNESAIGDLSDDGRYVTFNSWASNLVAGDTNGMWDVFVHDRQTGVTSRVSVASDGTQADSHSWSWGISGDGDSVAFSSDASNLVGGDTNGTADVFVHDRG